MELSCPLGIRALSRKYTDHALVFFSHIINPLLTKLARSRWLDIGLVLFWRAYGPRHAKKELGQYPAILTSCLVNNITHTYNVYGRFQNEIERKSMAAAISPFRIQPHPTPHPLKVK